MSKVSRDLKMSNNCTKFEMCKSLKNPSHPRLNGSITKMLKLTDCHHEKSKFDKNSEIKFDKKSEINL